MQEEEDEGKENDLTVIRLNNSDVFKRGFVMMGWRDCAT